MSKNDRSWIPGRRRPRLDRVAGAAAATGPRRDRERPPSRSASRSSTATPGASCRVLAGGRRRIVEVGTAYGFSTLWMALGQPADGTIVTIDPDRERTDLARGWWREAGIADERITVVNAPALEAFEARDPALAGPFDMVFIDALKPEYERVPRGARPAGSRRARSIAADNVLWSGRVSGARPAERRRCEHRRRSARSTRRCSPIPRFTATILPVGDGLLIAVVARLTRPSMSIAVRVRLFAIQRELAGTREVAARARRRGRRRGGLGGARRASPGPGARPRIAPLRAERRLRRPDDGRWPTVTRWR